MGDTKAVQSIDRALEILLSFSRNKPQMLVSELQERVGLARPTLYRILNTLESKGFVRSQGEPRRYELGYRIAERANLVFSHIQILTVGRPLLEALWQQTDETVGLMLPQSATVRVCALELRSRQVLAFARGEGETGETYLGASGKVLLAYMPTDEIERAVLAAEASGIDTAKLKGALRRIRLDGFAVSRGELTPGATAIAAPIFDKLGGIAGAVGLYGPAARLNGAKQPDQIKLVVWTAQQISAALGYNCASAERRVSPLSTRKK